jgi:hypothetical protein
MGLCAVLRDPAAGFVAAGFLPRHRASEADTCEHPTVTTMKAPTQMKPLALALLFLTLAVTSGAQSPDRTAMAQKFGQAAKANAAALKAYTWQMRVEVTHKGETRPAKLYAMRFDADGKVEKTELSAQAQAQASGGRERGMKGRIKDRKIAEAKEWAGELADLVKSYLTPSPPVLQTFFSKSTTVEAPGGLVQIVATDVIAPGDRLVYEIAPDTQALKRFIFNTNLEGDPVEGQVEFAPLPGGPNSAARTTVNIPAKQLSAKIENFQYVKQ